VWIPKALQNPTLLCVILPLSKDMKARNGEWCDY
jgi:hypothetical protein